MAFNSLSVTQGTQTPILTDNTGGTAGTLIGVMKISTDAAGTFTSLWNGNVGVNSGTVNTIGTLPNIPGGSIVVTSLPNLSQGSINVTAGTIATLGTLGTVGLLANGTLASSGTTTGVGTISNIGSLGMLNAGTISSLPNLPQGSINVTAGTINTGTINAGSIVVTAGTIPTLGTMGTLGLVNTVTTVSNLSNGSITVTAGTINAGTINVGTFNLLPLGGSVLTTAVAIGTTAGTAAIPTSALTNRKALIAYNIGTSSVSIGGTGVTLTSGIPIGTGQYTPSFDLGTGALYGIAATPGGTLIALEVS